MKDNILHVLALAKHKVPEFKELRGKQWVSYGERNDYPDYLISLYNRSAKHNAIISGKVHYITGKGLEAGEGADSKTKAFITNPNKYESLEDVLYKTALDLELFGGFALEVIYGKASGKVEEVYHIPFAKLRTNAEETAYYYTADWTKSNAANNADFRTYKPWNTSGTTGSKLFYYKQYSPKSSATDVYPLPEYLGCVPYIEIDHEIASFHLNNIKNGFWGSFMISFFIQVGLTSWLLHIQNYKQHG